MAMNVDPTIPDREASIPSTLAAELGRLDSLAAGIPSGVDAAVLSGAAGRIRAGRRRRMVVRLVPLAAAAGLAIAAWTLWPAAPAQPFTGVQVALRGDVNGDGRVDIVDALDLARTVETRGRTSTAWDLTGDGGIDRADVDAVAQMAVRLDGPAKAGGAS